MYAIIDIETTGMSAYRDKITEIAIAIHDGTKVINSFETLINPEVPIPYFITELTGIDNKMVEDAPKFYEVAKKIIELTENQIFVAHNVQFDYAFVREAFRDLGYPFSRKKLDTVKLARKSFPGLKSYSLGNLIRHFKIKTKNRHRAMADVQATVQIFEKILKENENEYAIKEFINLGVKETQLPGNITLDILHDLPEDCGVYYFLDKLGKPVYIGKSKNIKKRVMQHFANTKRKGAMIQKYVDDITFELTGSELIALIKESYEIKRHTPKINKAQKTKSFPYIVYKSLNTNGFWQLKIARSSKKNMAELDIVSEFPKIHSAKAYLNFIREEFMLCQKLLNLEDGDGSCFYHQINQCLGACVNKESPEEYNKRVEQATNSIASIFDENFIIIDDGIEKNERAVILIEDGDFRGYGFIDAIENADILAIKNAIKTYPRNPEIKKIIHRFLAGKNKAKILKF